MPVYFFQQQLRRLLISGSWRLMVTSVTQIPAFMFWGFPCDKLRAAFPNITMYEQVPGMDLILGTGLVRAALVTARTLTILEGGNED